MSSSEAFINRIIIPFLRGQKIFKISLQMKVEDANKESFKACLIDIADENPAQKIHLDNLLIKIFTELNITDPSKQKFYIESNENLYELLIHLYRDGHKHVGKLITLIEVAKPRNNSSTWLIPAFIIGFLSFAGAIFEKYQHNVFIKLINALKHFGSKMITWIKGVMSVARNAAVIGMITNSIGLLFTVKQIKNNALLSNSEKAYELLFACLTTSLMLAAYIVSFASAGSMTAIAGILFVASSCVEILKASISLISTNRRDQGSDELHHGMKVAEKAQYYRKLYDYRSQRALLILKVCTAVLTSLIVAAWTFFLPSLALTIGCIGAMVLTTSLGSYISNKMISSYNKQLQLKISEIDGIENDKYIEFTDTAEILRRKLAFTTISKLDMSKAETSVIDNKEDNTIKIITTIPAGNSFFQQPPEQNNMVAEDSEASMVAEDSDDSEDSNEFEPQMAGALAV